MIPCSIRPARPDEFPAVRAFYDRLIDDMQGMEYHPKWQKGVYPSEDALRAAVEGGTMVLALLNGETVGAMVLNHTAADGYESAPWSVAAAENEVTVVHMLGVSPRFARQGIGRQLAEEAVRLARAAGQKTLRLDVLDGNLPAGRLYRSVGFRYVTSLKLFYEDTGLCSFDLYEYPL